MSNDVINSAFELAGAFVVLLNVRQIRIDREVKGTDWRVVAFFSIWGCWNISFYPTVNAPLSAYAAIGLVTVNNLWLIHLAYYSGYLWQVAESDLPATKPLEST